MALGFTFCLSWRLYHKYTLHFCSVCGIRLASRRRTTRVHVDGDELVPNPTPGSLQGHHTMIAPSPLGPPPDVFDRVAAAQMGKRFVGLRAKRSLEMVVDKSLGLPSEVFDAADSARQRKLYTIECPDAPDIRAPHRERDRWLATKAPWTEGNFSRSRPHWRVSSCGTDLYGGAARELVAVRLGRDWNATFYTPDPANGMPTSRTIALGSDDEGAWRGPDLLFPSSAGVFYFREMRLAKLGPLLPAGSYTCLTDAYDRPLAVAYKKSGSHALVTFVEMSEGLLGEVLACYTVMKCQQLRAWELHADDD
jgi:hypothetical protein